MDMLVSTGNINLEYDVLGIVRTYFSTVAQKEPKMAVDIFDYCVEQLKEDSKKLGGNGVIHIRCDKENISAAYVQGSNFFVYGTAIRIKS